MKNNKTILMITIISLVLVFTGITYAYFTAFNSEGSTAEISFGPGKMLIEYADKSDALSLTKTNIQPSDTILIDKTFTLTGTNTVTADGGVTMPFTISLEYQNTFQNYELKLFLKRMDNNENIIINFRNDSTIDESWSAYPSTVYNYHYDAIEDWSNKTYTQEIASGYFKLSSEKQTVTLNLKMMFKDTNQNQDYNKGATFNGKIIVNESKDIKSLKFANDSWDEIAENVRAGKSSLYNIGDEKEVEIDGQRYTIRLANNSTPEECNGEEFSETACGFVVEFINAIEARKMNSTNTNVGGWPASNLRTYANGDFYNKLPSDLKNVIIDTKVITGHGSEDSENFISTDKVYLLSTHEVWEDVSPSTTSPSTIDTAYNNTRQLDYYKSKKVTADDNYSVTIKKELNSGNPKTCWLRSAWHGNQFFFMLGNYGDVTSYQANWSGIYFSPAFRIG